MAVKNVWGSRLPFLGNQGLKGAYALSSGVTRDAGMQLSRQLDNLAEKVAKMNAVRPNNMFSQAKNTIDESILNVKSALAGNLQLSVNKVATVANEEISSHPSFK